MRLLPTTAPSKDDFPRPEYLQGQEREIAKLFDDIHSFTKLSKNKLPCDGVMALFGIEDVAETGTKAALAAQDGAAHRRTATGAGEIY